MKYFSKVSILTVCLLCMQGTGLAAINTTFSNNYLEKQLNCQIKLADLSWSHNLWPQQNKQTKPKRSVIISDEQILNKIENNLMMAAVYKQFFKQEISPQMLQSEMDRMVSASEDRKRLTQLFQILDNDPQSIAECVARPNLLQNKLIDSYQWDRKIHANTQKLAQSELQKYLLDASNKITATIQSIEYRLQSNQTKSDALQQLKENKNIILLQADEFLTKLNIQTNKNNAARLTETKSAFIYEEIIARSRDSIQSKRIIWYKQDFFKWWHTLDKSDLQVSFPKYTYPFKLNKPPVVTKSSHLGFTESWQYHGNGFVFKQRVNHSAVWTGNEMIIWGGSDRFFNNALNTGGIYSPVTGTWRPVTLNNAPTARHSHSAVWTGTQMVIWGGMNGGTLESSGHLTNGARYNPVNNSWISMSSINAPEGRIFQQTVWTSNKMMVWGGYSYASNNVLNTGGIYDPANDTWSVINTNNAPSGRYDFSMVWGNGEMLVWGGYNPSGGKKNDGARYNLSTGQWTAIQTTGAPSMRRNHSAVWTGTEMIIWGGELNSGLPANDGKRYNPNFNSWSSITQTNAPPASMKHTAIMASGKMLIWGGKTTTGLTVNSGGVLDTNNYTWSAISNTNSPNSRIQHTAIWTGTEMIIWGGRQISQTSGTELSSGGRYDLVNNSWQATNLNQDTTQPRTDFTSIWTGNEMIIWGGKAVGIPLNTGGRYNPVTASWSATTLNNAVTVRYQHSAIWTGMDMLIWGGTDALVGSINNLSTGSRYNPTTDVWTAIPNLTGGARRLHTAVWSGSSMIIFGGVGGNDGNTALKLVSIYDPSPTLGGWSTISSPSAPAPRFFHTAVWLNGEMIIWGGEGNTGSLNSGGRYNPSTGWSPTNLNNAPSARRYHSALSTGSNMIIWGGIESNFQTSYDTGGIYDPINDSWIATSTTNAASPRALHSAVWTGTEMIIWGGILFDDIGGDVIYDTGARFKLSSNSWVTTTSQGVAPARYNHKALWTGDKMLVWGGQSASTEYSDLGIYTPYIPIPEGIFVNGFE